MYGYPRATVEIDRRRGWSRMAMLLDARYELRLSKREKEALEASATAQGMNASQYLRWLIKTHDASAVIKSRFVR